MERAKFGRMELGRCVTRNYGYIGCAVDVLSTLDDACSGHRACDISVSDPALVRTKPCPKDFAAYLDADYRCVPGKKTPSHLYYKTDVWKYNQYLCCISCDKHSERLFVLITCSQSRRQPISLERRSRWKGDAEGVKGVRSEEGYPAD